MIPQKPIVRKYWVQRHAGRISRVMGICKVTGQESAVYISWVMVVTEPQIISPMIVTTRITMNAVAMGRFFQ